MVQAIVREIELQKNYLQGQEVNTIYFGGGTPSLLSEDELELLLNALHHNFSIARNPEITLEANPDDLSPASLKNMAAAGINRLSIGIQSFHEPHLKRMNRAHDATEAANCVQLAQNAGFHNISIDLIYGVPAPGHSIWLEDLQKAFSLQVQHISSYALTIEPKTAFGKWAATGKFTGSTDDFVAEQFEILLEQMQAHDFEQYEISNFCRPGFYSRHNSNYWRGVPYLGLGPSAHSFSGTSRQHNIANNAIYMHELAESKIPFELDELTPEDQINEYILTSLRTKWGTDLAKLKKEKSVDLLQLHKTYLQSLLQKEMVRIEDDVLYLTDSGKLLADKIAADLFV